MSIENYHHLKDIKHIDNIDFVFVRPKSSEEDKTYYRENLDEFYDFLNDGYLYVNIEGGFQGFPSHKDMKRKCVLLMLAFYNDTLVAASIHNDYLGGNKCVGMTATTDKNYRKIGVGAIYKMISYATSNWSEWIWIEASGKIEEMFEESQKLLLDSDLGSTKIPDYMAIDIMGEGEAVGDGYHYKRYMTIITDEERTKVKIRKVMYGFSGEETYNRFVNEVDTGFQTEYNKVGNHITETYYRPMSKAQTILSYNRLIYLFNMEQCGEAEYLPKELINAWRRDIRIVEHGLKYVPAETAQYIIDDCKLILDKAQNFKPTSFIETLKSRNLI